MSSKNANKFKLYSIDSLNPARYNPRKISDGAFDKLVASIAKYGCPQPLIVNIRGGKNIIVGGHQRYKALQHLNWEQVPVVEVDLSEDDEIAFNITLNNPANQGEFTVEVKDLLNTLEAKIPEEFFNLGLNEVPIPVVNDNWDTDLEGIGSIKSDNSPVPAIIKVVCEDSIKDQIREIISDALEGYDAKIE